MAKEWFGVVLWQHEHQWLVEAPQLLVDSLMLSYP
jgi:hypothetical protein